MLHFLKEKKAVKLNWWWFLLPYHVVFFWVEAWKPLETFSRHHIDPRWNLRTRSDLDHSPVCFYGVFTSLLVERKAQLPQQKQKNTHLDFDLIGFCMNFPWISWIFTQSPPQTSSKRGWTFWGTHFLLNWLGDWLVSMNLCGVRSCLLLSFKQQICICKGILFI